MPAATSVDIVMTKTLVCDVMDVYSDDVHLLDIQLADFGGKTAFYGQVTTIKCLNDNSRVLEAVGQAGQNRVLVVDGGGSRLHSLLGGNLAKQAYDKGWSGIIINGCLRDVAELRGIPIGIKALASCPRRSIRQDQGERDIGIFIANHLIQPGDYIYADEDGIVVTDKALPNLTKAD